MSWSCAAAGASHPLTLFASARASARADVVLAPRYPGFEGFGGDAIQDNRLLVAALIGALTLEWALVWVQGPPVLAFSLLPLIVAAWRGGLRWGLGMAALVSIQHVALSLAVDGSLELLWTQWGLGPAILVYGGVGAGVGWLRERVQSQLRALAQAERMLIASEARYRLAADGANDGLWEWDVSARTMHYSDRWKEMLGWGVGEVSGASSEWFDRVHPDERKRLRAALDQTLDHPGRRFSLEFRIRHRDGSWRWIHCRGASSPDPDLRRVAGWFTDITDRKLAELQLRASAFRDPLTGLANRALFMDRLEHAVQRARRRGQSDFAVLLVDLDHFKWVNDAHGHPVGDELLQAAGTRLEATLRPGDTVARLGGDEFVVLLESVPAPGAALLAAGRIERRLQAPLMLHGKSVQMSASIGVVFSHGKRDASDLLRDADVAMYRAKSQGGGRAVLFDLALHAEVVRDRRIRHDLEAALKTSAFSMRFQPLVELETGRPVGFEGLARWNHPDLGAIGPDRFVALAEEAGTIGALGSWALAKALTRARSLQSDKEIPGKPYVSVNLSPREFRDGRLAERIYAALVASGLEPKRLCLEITETALLEEPASAVDTLRELRRAGVRVALDDFGTGYSSLSTLHRLPIDCLKIDQSFVQGLETDLDKRAIVESIIALGRRMDLLLVAEGIETEAQRQRLRQLGCTVGQGWLFGRPMAADEVAPWLKRKRSGA